MWGALGSETAAYQSVAAKLIKLVPIVSVRRGWPELPPQAPLLGFYYIVFGSKAL